MLNMKINNILNIWPSVSNTFSVPHSKRDYERLSQLLDELVDEVGNNDKHPLASLMETIGLLVAEYESKHIKMRSASGIDALKFLIEEHNLKQSDLEEIGTQGVVSEILNGKRELNLRQIRALSRRFSVPASVFV